MGTIRQPYIEMDARTMMFELIVTNSLHNEMRSGKIYYFLKQEFLFVLYIDHRVYFLRNHITRFR
jgi:hypothetical protein